MVAWRESCRQCGAKPAKGRAWCPTCIKRLHHLGVTDWLDIPTKRECLNAGVGGPGRPASLTEDTSAIA